MILYHYHVEYSSLQADLLVLIPALWVNLNCETVNRFLILGLEIKVEIQLTDWTAPVYLYNDTKYTMKVMNKILNTFSFSTNLSVGE